MSTLGPLLYLYVGTADLEADLRFYTGPLGARLVWRFQKFGADVAGLRFGDGAHPMVLLADHRPPRTVMPIFAVENLAAIVGPGIERHTIARADRQLPGSCHHRPCIGVDSCRSVLGPGCPGADGHATIGNAPRHREPRRPKADPSGDSEREHGSEEQTHGLIQSELSECRV